MSIVRSDRALDVVVDDGVIPGAAGDGAATDHRSSISVATPSNLRCSHVVLLKTVSPRVNSGVAKNARYPRICVRIVERGSRSFGAHSRKRIYVECACVKAMKPTWSVQCARVKLR